ncbi:MAG: thioredoxin domain-containing protein [Candidatus Nanopelagicales bacterium]|nr:thioredoxin domain-containing protein [Actinomycetota bacterium]HNL52266.1 thioredoxin domain-containing protein [Actinomycetota bacterium]HRY10345.1 thioredoxin domain-containing protein [Candidatus Nanopelagicales bacterium]
MRDRRDQIISPYLLAHADNPVDWWEWQEDAFDEAVRRDVPVVLSVGYAACHWCHVMAHESFEDPAIAALMNERFVSIKVDREERPDVDAMYMAATTAMTGHGGWPMTVFLDHERRPFYAGTYYPPEPRSGMPSFRLVLEAVSDAWRDQRDRVLASAAQISAGLRTAVPSAVAVDEGVATQAVEMLSDSFDARHGGFGRAPKFPQPMVHEFLLRHHARTGDPRSLEMVERTLTAMASGGMYDQLAGGFARYSVDTAWLVPHFEKMLYDNALLLRVYLHWWRQTGSELARSVVAETAEFLLSEMRTPQGCFAASLDADSEGREGAFYVWTPEQLRAVGADPEMFGVTEGGTFEHRTSVLQRPVDPGSDWPQVRAALRAARSERPRPGRDDKVVVAWNAWAIAGLAEAGALLGRPEWTQSAVECRDALWAHNVVEGDVRRVSRDGVPGAALGVLEDYAALACAEFTLCAVTGEDLDRGLQLVTDLSGVFLDQDRDTAATDVPTAGIDMTDNATPSGWSLAAEALLTASALTGEMAGRSRAEQMLGRAAHLAGYPQFWGHGLAVLEALVDGPREVALLAGVGSPMHVTALAGTAPGAVVALSGPLCEGRSRIGGQDTAYVCRQFVCDAPTTDPEVLARQVR